MLDQYREQGMFGEPMALPTGANALHMLWTYLLKTCGTRKSRLVCNGNPRQKGSVTLGHVYANALDAASERLFWALVAQEGMTAIGFDVSNAFAEAPPPKAPLYLYIDDAYREWWTQHLGNPPIPKECNVVQVCYAIQGHPESACLWGNTSIKYCKIFKFIALHMSHVYTLDTLMATRYYSYAKWMILQYPLHP